MSAQGGAGQGRAPDWFDVLFNGSGPEPVTVAPEPTTERHYFKCADCLQPMALDTESKAQPERLARESVCDCGGKIEYMGRVQRRRVVTDGTRCACDERCTGASGPSCECACGGKNHGTGAVVDIVRDAGAIPRFLCSALSKARAQEYRGALAAATLRYEIRWGAVASDKRAGRWVSSDDYWGWQEASRELAHARGLRTQAGRLKALGGVCQ